jgi:urate oxidase
MGIVLGPNQYGKAEVRVVTVDRGGPEHRISDLNVTTTLRGDFSDAHLVGDNAHVLATDTQKNTVYAFARDGIGHIEQFGMRLAGHFASAYPWIDSARIEIEQLPWARITVGGQPHRHAFMRPSGETRTAVVTVQGDQTWVVSGLAGMVVLKSTGSEFSGFPRDRYTTLAETDDRILATAVTARWRYAQPDIDYAGSFAAVRALLLQTFASTHSKALQQTLYAMGSAVLAGNPEVAEIRLSMPNQHHLLVDLSPFELDNPNVVYHADDRPYGLIEGTVQRDDAPDPGPAWLGTPGFC